MNDLTRTARTTGLWYLALAITGVLGFLVVRPAIFVSGNPAETARKPVEHAALARVGVALEFGIVASHAIVAVWFYKLFRSLHQLAAGTLAAFGLINAMAILASAAAMAVAHRNVLINFGVMYVSPDPATNEAGIAAVREFLAPWSRT